MLPDWEPLLPDHRVDKIAELLRITHPDLHEADFITFIVPPQIERDRRKMKHAPHDPECPFTRGMGDGCDCGPLEIPAQAMFAVKSKHPRTWDPVYRGKELVTFSGVWHSTWEAEEKQRAHYVSAREDPAWSIFYLTAQRHVEKMKGYRELI